MDYCTVVDCLEKFCESNSITHFSILDNEHTVYFLIDPTQFAKLEAELKKQYPDVKLDYRPSASELLRIDFGSKVSLSHFLLSWS